MELRRVGRSGLWVSPVSLGCNNFGMKIDAAESKAVVDAAIDAGVTLFDTAESYGGGGRSEEHLGAALQGRRDEVLIATKFGSPSTQSAYPSGGSRRYVVAACEASLRRLGTEWIDLYYLHYVDAHTPIEETLAALDDLVRAGKVRYIASSNLAAWQIAEAEHVARASGGTRFVATQAEWSLVRRRIEREIVPACEHYGVGVVPYFPLASGLLTGKYVRGEAPPAGTRFAALPRLGQGYTEGDWDKVARLDAFARERGRTVLELAMSWLAAQPAVPTVLVGATSPAQVRANVEAIGWALTPEDLAAVDALLASD
jgi:aryl-alcohol dehydrogenase-like predicted oxidoreductase